MRKIYYFQSKSVLAWTSQALCRLDGVQTLIDAAVLLDISNLLKYPCEDTSTAVCAIYIATNRKGDHIDDIINAGITFELVKLLSDSDDIILNAIKAVDNITTYESLQVIYIRISRIHVLKYELFYLSAKNN